MIWAWIGDMEPVSIEEDLPLAMKVPGIVNLVHFTKVWTTNWAFLFDNFIDGLHAPYLHRLSPQFLLRRLQYRVVDGKPRFQFVEHDGKALEASHVRAKNTEGLVFQMEFPGLGKFPVNNWWRFRSPKTKPKTNFMPGVAPGLISPCPAVLRAHGAQEPVFYPIYYSHRPLPSLQHVRHHREILKVSIRWWWKYYFKIFSITHDRLFIGQDHRVLRYSRFGPERLSPLDQDVIYWRKFAARNARGHMKNQKSNSNEMNFPDESAEFNTLREVL